MRGWTWWLPRVSAVVGILLWSAYVIVGDGVLAIGSIFLFAPLVIVPLALSNLGRPNRNGSVPLLYRAAVALQPAAALLVLFSFMRPVGMDAGVMAVPWLVLTGILALLGLSRFFPRGPGPTEELLIDVGLLYTPIGAAWLLASRTGYPPLGFVEPIVLLTAVHFHYAAFALPVLVALLGRAVLPAGKRVETIFRFIAAGLLVGPILLALGITFSNMLERAATIVLGGSAVGATLVALFTLARSPMAKTAKASVAFAFLGLGVSMPIAALFAFGTWNDIDLITRTHGAINAYLVCFVGLLTFALAEPTPRAPPAGPPFSRLRSVKTTGPDFFERTDAVDTSRPVPRGMSDRLLDYARPGFDPAKIHPDIRAFYEDTAAHSLVVVPHWRRGFRLGARIYAGYARRSGQMSFPLKTTDAGELIHSRMVAVKTVVDGRANVRAWIRTYAATGEPVYVAAYSTHEHQGETYMNIAFPFPGRNETSILRLEEFGNGGLLLTSRPTPERWGDQGVYSVHPWFSFRLPIDETIKVWTPDDPTSAVPRMDVPGQNVTVVARHDIFVFGIRALTMDYQIFRTTKARSGDSSAAATTIK